MIKSLYPWGRTESEQITDLHISNNEKLQQIRDLTRELKELRAKNQRHRFAYISLKRKSRRG